MLYVSVGGSSLKVLFSELEFFEASRTKLITNQTEIF